jgi:hypothetical protein
VGGTGGEQGCVGAALRFASNYGWVRGVWVRGDGAGASRPDAVTPRLPRENLGGDASEESSRATIGGSG